DLVDSHSDWFSEGVTKRIGNGYSTSFWFDAWVDGVPLRTRYQSLFQVSDQCLDRVVDMGSWVSGEWEWEFRWKSNLDPIDQNLLTDLIKSLRQVRFSSTKDDWCWRHEPDGLFSVKSAYLVLEDGVRLHRSLPGTEFVNLARVWDSWAASKVIVFSWQLLQDMIPTRQNLRRRRVTIGSTNTSCVFVGQLRSRLTTFLFLVTEFLLFGTASLGMILVWHAVVWTIWTSRNDIIFAGGSSTIDTLVDKVKHSS
ncbi:putative ribonuclease H protein, partial [Trifolium medium]|nr:putative ribonuclease H protein [Trifolium medium]